MALIDCPECSQRVSDVAKACPHCGFPVADHLAPPPDPPSPKAKSTEVVAEIRPSWWGYAWHLVFFFLVIPPIVAWFQRAATVLRIYPDRITLERGILAKCYQDYTPRDIRSIDIDQTFFQRFLGIGDLTIATAAAAEGSEKILNIPDPKGVRDLILTQRGDR